MTKCAAKSIVYVHISQNRKHKKDLRINNSHDNYENGVHKMSRHRKTAKTRQRMKSWTIKMLSKERQKHRRQRYQIKWYKWKKAPTIDGTEFNASPRSMLIFCRAFCYEQIRIRQDF